MKNTIKIMALVMAALLVVSAFAACGDAKKNEETTAAAGNDAGGKTDNGSEKDSGGNTSSVKGETGEHGYFKEVLVPEGYTLKHEDAFGKENPDSFSIYSNDNAITQFTVGVYTKDEAEMGIETTRSINGDDNEIEDISIEAGGKTWTGIAYNYGGTMPCFNVCADFGDNNYVSVMGAGNAYDSDITTAVLASFVVEVPAE